MIYLGKVINRMCGGFQRVVLFAIGMAVFLSQVSFAEGLRFWQLPTPLDIGPQLAAVLDRNGETLAVSVKTVSLAFRASKVPEADKPYLKRVFLNRLKLDAQVIDDLFDTSTRKFIWLKRRVSTSEAVALMREIKARSKNPAEFMLSFPDYERVYVGGVENLKSGTGELTAETRREAAVKTGDYTTDDLIRGVEEIYFDRLFIHRPDWRRTVWPSGTEHENSGTLKRKNTPARAILTLDSHIQNLLEAELLRALRKYRAEKAMGLVMLPATGEILALASCSRSDSENISTGQPANPLIAETYQPGSALKIAGLALLLSENPDIADFRFNCRGYQYFPRQNLTLHCYANHGDLSLKQIVSKSCEAGFIAATRGLRHDKLFGFLTGLGFRAPTDVGLPGEVSGRLLHQKYWPDIEANRVMLGYDIEVTPLQMAVMFSTLVNGGKLVRPSIMARIDGSAGATSFLNTSAGGRVISETVSKTIRNVLQNVVDVGTGKQAAISGIPLGGITGTTDENLLLNGESGDKEIMSSFYGFLPDGDREYVIGIILKNPVPVKGTYAGAVAAPVFRNVAEGILK